MSGEGVERGPGLGDQVGEKRGFGIPARIGDRTKRSRAGSGSGGAAGGSMRGIAVLLLNPYSVGWVVATLLLLCRDRARPTAPSSILGGIPANLKRTSYLFARINH